MRVLYVHQYFSAPFGFFPGRTFVLASELARAGYCVTICTGFCLGADSGIDSPFKRGVRFGSWEGMRIIQLKVAYSNSMELSARCSSFVVFAVATLILALSRRWEIVVSSSTPLTVVAPLIVSKVVWGSRCVFEVRDRWPEVPAALGVISGSAVYFAYWLEMLAVKIADSVIVLAPSTLVGYRRLGCELKALFLVPNGCDENAVFLRRVNLGIEGVREGSVKVAYFGSLGLANGLKFFLNVAEICLNWGYPFVFLLIGDGKMRDVLVLRTMRRHLRSVMFFDSVPRCRLREVLSALDVAFHCLDNHLIFSDAVSPNKIFEALSAGMPVITNCQSWIGRRLTECGAGVVLPAGDTYAFVRELVKLGADSEKRTRMGWAGVQVSWAEFSVRRFAVQFSDFLGGHEHIDLEG